MRRSVFKASAVKGSDDVGFYLYIMLVIFYQISNYKLEP